MKYTLSVLAVLAFTLAAVAQPSPTLPPTRLAPGSGVTITTNGVNNFTIAASGGSSVTNLGNGSNTLLATNLSVYSSGSNTLPLKVFASDGSTERFSIDTNGYVNIRNANTLQLIPLSDIGVQFAPAGTGARFAITYYGDSWITASPGSFIGWSSYAIVNGNQDTSLYRNAAGVVEINNGTAGTYRDARLRTLQMYAQPSDPSSSATLGMIYAKTNAGTTEVFVMDGAGNVTQISPHARAASPAPPELDTDAQPIVIHHANLFLGTEEFLHLSALAKEVEKLSGKKFLFQRPLDPARKRDWNTEETAIEQRHAAERAADLERLTAWQSNTNQNKGPQPPVRPAYQKRTKPAWLP